MRLCEEYAQRKSLIRKYVIHSSKGFVYFEGGRKILTLLWCQDGIHPGFYQFSECLLKDRIVTLNTHEVSWGDYESWLTEWKKSKSDIVFCRDFIFRLTWEYFLRRNEVPIMEEFPLSVIFPTLDENNPSRVADAIDLVDRISLKNIHVSKFWHEKAFEVVSKYMYWIRDI